MASSWLLPISIHLTWLPDSPFAYWKPIDGDLTLSFDAGFLVWVCSPRFMMQLVLSDVSHIDMKLKDPTSSWFLSRRIEASGWRLNESDRGKRFNENTHRAVGNPRRKIAKRNKRRYSFGWEADIILLGNFRSLDIRIEEMKRSHYAHPSLSLARMSTDAFGNILIWFLASVRHGRTWWQKDNQHFFYRTQPVIDCELINNRPKSKVISNKFQFYSVLGNPKHIYHTTKY